MSASTTSLVARLESAISAAKVNWNPVDCAKYRVDGVIPSAIVKPTCAAEVAEIVQFAIRERLAVIPCGRRTKLGIGMPPTRYDLAVNMTGLNQIAHYDRDDLTLSVDAGMDLAQLANVLATQNQFIPLVVPFFEQSTVGGSIASGIGSAVRHTYGSARDFLIGAEFVNGSGALTKSGGRVVKNVTGYDLHKLLIGSLGTLGIITRLNFRTFPSPEKSAHLVATFLSLESIRQFQDLVAKSHLKPSAFDVLDPEAAKLLSDFIQSGNSVVPNWFAPGHWHVCMAFEGPDAIIKRYSLELSSYAEKAAVVRHSLLDESADKLFAIGRRELLNLVLQSTPEPTVFRINILPTLFSDIFRLLEIAKKVEIPCCLAVSASGPLCFALRPEALDEAVLASLTQATAEVFAFAESQNGTASILFCPGKLKVRVDIWGKPRNDASLMRRLKTAFDPGNVFAPGRFVAGI